MTGDRRLFLVGLSHKSAPIDVRERVALTGDALKAALCELKAMEGVTEALVVSTCNRVEVFVHSDRPDAARRFFTERSPRRPTTSTRRTGWRRSGTCSASPPASTRWWSASSRSSAR